MVTEHLCDMTKLLTEEGGRGYGLGWFGGGRGAHLRAGQAYTCGTMPLCPEDNALAGYYNSFTSVICS